MPPSIAASASRQERDAQLSPSRSAKDAAGVIQSWGTQSEQARRSPGIRTFLDLAYGPAANQRLDIYTGRAEEGDLHPILIFIHGGFWQEGSKDISAFPARAFAAANWMYIAVGYTLAPNATLTSIVEEIRSALRFIRLHAREFGGDPDRIIVAGHSAGGHLAACLLGDDTGRNRAAPCAGVVAISGVFDLAPIRASYVNDAVRMTEDEVVALSPALHQPAYDVPVVLVVGRDETNEFIRQTDMLARAWKPYLTTLSVATIPGKDHFDVVLGLADPSSRLFQVVTGIPGNAPEEIRTAAPDS
jgi:arylformamidase